MVKILALVKSCNECPNKHYYSGNQHSCSQLDTPTYTQVISRETLEKGWIASFCPLRDYPSKEIGGLEATVSALRDTNSKNLTLALFGAWASIFGGKVDQHGRLVIQTEDKDFEQGELVIDRNMVTKIDLTQGEMHINYKGVNMILVNANTPEILKEYTGDNQPGMMVRVALK